MKKIIFTMLFVAVATGAFAQMQVWSNGTIIFSHNANEVDSISFVGSPMKVQANTQSASTSSQLVGKIYGSQSSSTNAIFPYFGLCFVDESNGYVTKNGSSTASYSSNPVWSFTYSISGSQIKLSFKNYSYPAIGVLVGTAGIVFTDIKRCASDPSSDIEYSLTFYKMFE